MRPNVQQSINKLCQDDIRSLIDIEPVGWVPSNTFQAEPGADTPADSEQAAIRAVVEISKSWANSEIPSGNLT